MLVEKGFMIKQKIGRTNFYINQPLYVLFKGNTSFDKNVDPITTINPVNS